MDDESDDDDGWHGVDGMPSVAGPVGDPPRRVAGRNIPRRGVSVTILTQKAALHHL